MYEVSKAGVPYRSASGTRSFTKMEGKAVRHMGKVFALLLGFAMLPEKYRREFLVKMNEFLIMSPTQKRRVVNEWQQVVEDGQEDGTIG
ncbi:hypothetical protein [Burkholderia sp. PU8-34]